MIRLLVLALALVLMLSNKPLYAQGTFGLVSQDPVISTSKDGTWRSRYNEPGAMIYYEGLYHMFITSGSSWPSPSGIGYASSEDGIHWDVLDDPILTKDDIEGYEPISIGANSVYVADDGTWVMYFYCLNSYNWPNNKTTIGRATAPAPVLLPGAEGSWDQDSVSFPSVILTDNGYVMFYTGQTESANRQQLGMATSEDGITWIKNPDPVFTPNRGEYPIVLVTSVIATEQGYAMIFKNSRSTISFATSADGIIWERGNNGEPVFGFSDVPNVDAIGVIDFIAVDDGYYVAFEGESATGTRIYAVSGPLE